MGILDTLLMRKQPARKYNNSPSSAKKRTEPLSEPKSSNTSLKKVKDNQVEKTDERETLTLKVTDTSDIDDHIQLQIEHIEDYLPLYCPIRYAKIYCHSFLIDKLGDLTKFIIESLHKGHTIDEVCELTQMGKTTIKEELDYLIRGGLVNEDRNTLTELGEQYGVLLERFEALSDGIDAAFNLFAELFEPIEDEKYIENPDEDQIISGHFIPVLARNDNYKNSLEIAEEHIEADMPFCYEIRSSLYTTVKIDRTNEKYKPVYIRNFGRGYFYKYDPCITVAIPYYRVSCIPKYRWIDQYRGITDQISSLADTCPELLSSKAKKIICGIKEENEADMLTKDINTLTGEVSNVRNELVDENELHNYKPIIVPEWRPVQIILEGDDCKDIYLQEIERKELYLIRYFSYDRMEV